MKKILCIISMLFLLSTPCFAATWEYKIIRTSQQPWGLEVLVEFESNLNETRTVMFVFDDMAQVQSDGPTRVINKTAGWEKARSILNQFDLGENSKEILKKVILYVRENPGVTLNGIISLYDTVYPDAVWKGAKFVERAADYLKEELGFVPTWEQFKTYVINTQFEGID